MSVSKKQRIFLGIVGIIGLGMVLGFWSRKETKRTTMVEEEARNITVACVGDSITYGYGLSERSRNAYPEKLNALLGNAYQVENFGDSGSCVQSQTDQPYQETEAYQQSISFAPDVLIFMMGTNDTKTENWQGTEVFRQELLKLLDSYMEKENVPKVYLCTPSIAYALHGDNDGVVNFQVQPKHVQKLAECVREIALERGYPLIDIYKETAQHPEWFREDGIHPDEKGAEAIAKAVAAEILREMDE